ncbi:MAG: hypothetical protein EOP04_03645 [Proteobacteria bacterium]|nr:MAG: hypothetical protein EOP04_03645 [Pseudomonadota bacterium]
MSWHELDSIDSRGKVSAKAQSLGALHDKRKETLSQFFTPSWVVDFMWKTIAHMFLPGKQYSLLDSSLGSASMFRHALPSVHKLSGFDVDEDLVRFVGAKLEALGFEVDVKCGSMEKAELKRFSVALINPPFSIPIGSRSLRRFDGVTTYGKAGPHSSALSHKYALMQALHHSDIVCAVLPKSFCDEIKAIPLARNRLAARYRLPSDTFRAESVEAVSTELLIFGNPDWSQGLIDERAINPSSIARQDLKLGCRALDALPWAPASFDGGSAKARIKNRPTADKRVLLKRAGRVIHLEFFDGVTEARVLNRILEARIKAPSGERMPKNTKFLGQYRLSIDVLLLQDDPFKALDDLCQIIKGEGGRPEVTLQLSRSIKKDLRRHDLQTAPFGKVVYRNSSAEVSARAKVSCLLDLKNWRSRIKAGEIVRCVRSALGFLVTTSQGVFDCTDKAFGEQFDIVEGQGGAHWEVVHPPLKVKYSKEIMALEAKAKALSICDWLTWDYQIEDLMELALKPYGAICAWQMALGKTRELIALGLISSGPTLIVVKSRLVAEMLLEMKSIGLSNDCYQEIKGPNEILNLKKLNIITLDRLKRPLRGEFPKLTPAKMLRKKISNLIVDEGGLLSNDLSTQSKAVWQVMTKKAYVFDGTAMPNYPREMMPLAAWAVGEARCFQPYSRREGFVSKELWTSAEGHRTGRDVFTDRFICFEWATNEFLDSGKGAKREVPKLKQENIPEFRRWVDSFVKRRVQQEPAVQKHVNFPVPNLHEPISLDWDFEHLQAYVQTAEEFSSWYRRYKEDQLSKKKTLNLALILARLEACFKAANTPSIIDGCAKPYLGLTSKERAILNDVLQDVRTGRRPIVFARNPLVISRLARELEQRGISYLAFTGQDSIAKRNRLIVEKVRSECVQVMLASTGVVHDGLNLPQFNVGRFYNRSYKATEEYQSIYRMIRPQQKSAVDIYYYHLKGSLDEYQGQLVSWKEQASRTGLDYGHQSEDAEFAHFEVFISRFIETVPHLKQKLDSLKRA